MKNLLFHFLMWISAICFGEANKGFLYLYVEHGEAAGSIQKWIQF